MNNKYVVFYRVASNATSSDKDLMDCKMKVLRILINARAISKWKFWSSKPDQVPFEEIAMLVAEWSQPIKPKDILFGKVDSLASLGSMAEEVLKQLKVKNPKHLIFNSPKGILISWEKQNLEDNQFNSIDSREVLDLIVQVMFVQQRFRVWKNRSFEHVMSDQRNIYNIEKVREKKHHQELTKISLIYKGFEMPLWQSGDRINHFSKYSTKTWNPL